MKKYVFIILLFFICSCKRQGNDKVANVLNNNGKTYIQLTGRRVALVHDLSSIFTNNLVEDTLLLQVPSIRSGIINGSQIPVEQGYYTYSGYILIQSDSITVNLFINNTDSKKLVPELYNGVYQLRGAN